MSASLSTQTIDIVKATVPALAEHGTAITQAMYRHLFENAEIAPLFNQTHQQNGMQAHALAAAILAYARNIENLSALGSAIERIAQKHIGFNIHAEHYPHVATALLRAIKEVLGEAANSEILSAWGEAYWFLANILICRERSIRTDLMTHEGGWTDWRCFVITERTAESETITSFTLRPQDGGPVIRHKAGQYLTFSFEISGLPNIKRNYSISCGPNTNHYRITVKREAHAGASSFLHDQASVGSILQCTPPAGDFYLDDTLKRPVVLLSGGVGLTPLVSMMEVIANTHPDVKVCYIHGTTNRSTHALDEQIRILAERHGNTTVTTFYEHCEDSDNALPGFITLEWLRTNTPFAAADFYLCGPPPFLRSIIPGLTEAGVPPAQVHYEMFGPMSEALMQ